MRKMYAQSVGIPILKCSALCGIINASLLTMLLEN